MKHLAPALSILEDAWKQRGPIAQLLQPLSWLYQSALISKRWAYQLGICQAVSLDLPIWAVGNVTVGGCGKTPLVIAMTDHLISQGKKPAVVASGYGGRKSRHETSLITANCCPEDWGDEAILLANRLSCPVAAGKNRAEACQKIIDQHHCDMIICDDAWMHWAL